MDDRALAAREHHAASYQLCEQSDAERIARNQLVRQLRAEDPERWTYTALARAVGCSRDLIAAIIQGRT